MSGAFDRLLAEVRACTVCAPHLPLGPRPVLRGRPSARLLIISQAPGTRVHETGLSFDDKSGDRLRQWLGLDRDIFYDESRRRDDADGLLLSRTRRARRRPPAAAGMRAAMASAAAALLRAS